MATASTSPATPATPPVSQPDRPAPTASLPRRPRSAALLLSTASAAVLAVSMFALKWYGVDGMPGRSRALSSAVNAWQALTVGSRLMLFTVVLAAACAALRAVLPGRAITVHAGASLVAVAGLTAVLVADRVLIDPPAPAAIVDQKLGALVGLLASLGLVVGAWAGWREQRAAGGLRASALPPRRA